MDGLTALPRVLAAAPDAEVVVLTASEDEHNLLGAIRGGAAGYLLKSEPPERIVAFLRGVAQGEAALSGPIARRLLDQVREGGGPQRRSSPSRSRRALSARELEVLLLLDRHLGTDEIATRLFISEHTVRSHVKSLLAKLGVSSRREALDRLAAAGARASWGLRIRRAPRRRGRAAFEVVAALEHGGDARRERRGAPREVGEASRGDAPCSASGSSTCASKPAETSSSSGSKRGDRALDGRPRLEVPLVAGARRQRDVEERLALLVGPPVPG